jgi:hypothetical protein
MNLNQIGGEHFSAIAASSNPAVVIQESSALFS